MFRTLSNQEKLDLLTSKPNQEKYKMVGHTLKPLKGVGKSYCIKCGLIALNNKFTNWCIDKGCNYDVHSQYQSARTKFTKLEV